MSDLLLRNAKSINRNDVLAAAHATGGAEVDAKAAKVAVEK